jgi:hypothetical protein
LSPNNLFFVQEGRIRISKVNVAFKYTRARNDVTIGRAVILICVTGPIYNLGADRFPAVNARSVTAPATLPGALPTEAESTKTGFKRALDYDDREERERLLEDEGDVSEAGAIDPRRRHARYGSDALYQLI